MRVVFVGAFLFMLGLFFHVSGGRLEGLIHPVVTKGEITRTEVVGETGTRIWGHSQRLRDCNFVGLSWRLGDLSHYSVADLIFEEGTHVRPGGYFDFGPWVVQLTPDQLDSGSYAIVYHRCHPLWVTETFFFGDP